MIYRRGVLPVLVLLFIVAFGAVARVAAGTNAPAPPAPARTPAAVTGGAVVGTLEAVQRAFDDGDVQLLCRAGGLVDPAVIREQDAQPGGCASELEALMANAPPMRLKVTSVTLRPDLATAVVTTASGQRVSVDLLRRGHGWLLSFSDGDDPLPALA